MPGAAAELEYAVAVGVEGEGNSPAPDQPLHQDEITPGVLRLPERGVGHYPRGVVNCQEQDESGPALLQPRMVAAVNLDQHPRLGHTLPADPVFGWSTPAGVGQACSGKDAAHRLTAEVNALTLSQQIREVSVVCAGVMRPGQIHNCRSHVIGNDIRWLTSPVPVSQGGGTLLAICCQNSPGLAFRNPQNLGSLGHRQMVFQHVVQYLKPYLLSLVQCHVLHRTDIFPVLLVTDLIVGQQQVVASWS